MTDLLVHYKNHTILVMNDDPTKKLKLSSSEYLNMLELESQTGVQPEDIAISETSSHIEIANAPEIPPENIPIDNAIDIPLTDFPDDPITGIYNLYPTFTADET